MRHGKAPSSPSLLAAALVLAACNATPVDDAGGKACVSTRTFFARDVWASYMSTSCFKCHSPDGVAVVKNGARFVLQPATYPGFLDENLAALREISKIDYEGTSELLLKPVGKMSHGGGQVLDPASPQYAALQELLDRFGKPDSCVETGTAASLDGVQLLDAKQTLRKAALHLAGRLPTDDENAKLSAGGEGALDAALDGLMSEDAFYGRVQEMWNDVLLTDKYQWRGRGYPIAVYQLNAEDYPGAADLRKQWESGNWKEMTDAERVWQNDALGREPLNLIASVVRNDLPFTEILTADYALVDDALARVYRVDDGKTGWRKAQVKYANGTLVPHAGILSTPMWLNRYTTTATNRSRHRARALLKTFLATDILKLADRPIDVALVTQKDNPTMNADQCTVCHRVIDPIAGGFRGYDEADYERFKPDRPWHDDMVPPAFGEQELPSGSYGAALPWLAQQIAADPRFDLAVVYQAYTGLTGHQPLPYPLAGADFEPRLKAWNAQDAFFRQLGQAFRDHNRSYKALVRGMVKSPSYRAVAVPGASDERLAELDPLGTARLLSPEMLDRKLLALTGVHWRKQWDWAKAPQDWLSDTGIAGLYGGIDSDAITERAVSLNGVMSNLAWRMATELACLAVPYDFAKPPEKRLLFTKVLQAEVPESAGHPVPGSVDSIKANIAALYERLLGETAGPAEVDAAFELFLETWREGTKGPLVARSLVYQCGISPVDGTNLPDEVRRDATYTVRSWMAVTTYLLSDYRVLYE